MSVDRNKGGAGRNHVIASERLKWSSLIYLLTMLPGIKWNQLVGQVEIAFTRIRRVNPSDDRLFHTDRIFSGR
jgi:hypothetical protein